MHTLEPIRFQSSDIHPKIHRALSNRYKSNKHSEKVLLAINWRFRKIIPNWVLFLQLFTVNARKDRRRV